MHKFVLPLTRKNIFLLYGSDSKYILYPYTALQDFLYMQDSYVLFEVETAIFYTM